MLPETIDSAATLGALSMRIDMQTEFANRLSQFIGQSIGRLVDADMNEVSTRLKALQTQQQLAIQALSIANSNSENIAQLFR
ncbi:flagellin [Rhizobium sp. BIGb0125]|nr:flagellin [Rhizobium sp. BIGb0125]